MHKTLSQQYDEVLAQGQIELPELEDREAQNPAEYNKLDYRTLKILRHKNDPKFLATLTVEQKEALEEFLADYEDWQENEKDLAAKPSPQ